MSRIHLWLAAILVAAMPVYTSACDICGCGVGTSYFGLMPQMHQNLVGLRWRESSFRSSSLHDGGSSRDFFRSLELTARYYPARRWQITAFVPMNFNYRETDERIQHQSGLGDAAMVANFSLWTRRSSNAAGAPVRHLLLLGGGAKLPTGHFREANGSHGEALPNFQLGTGSVDFLASLGYTLRHPRWGLHAESGVKINTPNPDDYRFGHRLNGQAFGFAVVNLSERSYLMPMFGGYAEASQIDRKEGRRQSETGGHLVNAIAGAELFVRQMSVGAQLQWPLAHDLAEGAVEAGPRFSVNAAYLF